MDLTIKKSEELEVHVVNPANDRSARQFLYLHEDNFQEGVGWERTNHFYTAEGKPLGVYKSCLHSGTVSRIWLENLEGKWGALDLQGNPAIPFVYDSAETSSYFSRLNPAEYDLVMVTRGGSRPFYVDAAGREYREAGTASAMPAGD